MSLEGGVRDYKKGGMKRGGCARVRPCTHTRTQEIVRMDLDSGETLFLRLITPPPGTFDICCGLWGGRSSSMDVFADPLSHCDHTASTS